MFRMFSGIVLSATLMGSTYGFCDENAHALIEQSCMDRLSTANIWSLIDRHLIGTFSVHGFFREQHYKTQTSNPSQPEHDRATSWIQFSSINGNIAEPRILEVSYGSHSTAFDKVRFQLFSVSEESNLGAENFVFISEVTNGRNGDLTHALKFSMNQAGEIFNVQIESQSQKSWPSKPIIIRRTLTASIER